MAERSATSEFFAHSFTRWVLVPPLAVVLAHLGNSLIPVGAFPAPFFVASVMITAHLAGVGPGVVAGLIAALMLDYFHVEPLYSFTIRADLWPSMLQFIVPSVLGCWFVQKRKTLISLLERETALTNRLQGDQSLSDLGASVLGYLAPEMSATLAAFYTVDPDGTARRQATHAFDLSAAPAVIAPGDGAVGQAIIDQRLRVLDVPPDYVNVRSSLGQRRPKQVVLVPASDGERTHALLELGFLGKLAQDSLHFFERVAEPIAIATRTAVFRARLRDLLEETRRQAEELKTHEEELRAANEELEDRARVMSEAQRTLEQQQIEVEQTNQTLREQAGLLERQNEELATLHDAVRARSEEAERANRAKSQFLANMSHELRTPLNSSLILAKLLMEDRDGNLSPEQIRFAETIHGAGNDLLAMIDEILDLAKIEAGKLELEPQEIPISRVRDELSRMFEPIALERNVHFDLRTDEANEQGFSSDLQRLLQILKNLLSNAFKFTDKGQVSLTISSQRGRCRFVVRDTGIGIAADQLGSIFEAFQQADGTANRKHGGTGLGLTISRDLARLLAGDIQVESTVGHGSTFTLDLPLRLERSHRSGAEPAPVPVAREPARPPEVRAPRPQPTNGSTPVASRGRSILIVEDDRAFAEIVAELARELQFETRIAGSADEAIVEATAHCPDCIVLDMNLPDHSGLSVLDRLKREPRTRHVPVHVISVADYRRAALEMGAVGYMLKPVEREQIKTALRRLEGQFTRTQRRLLVVEDDLAQRDAICQLLGGDHIEIVAVGTVQEALEQLRAGPLDCIVTDLALPDATGYDLLRTMALDEAYSFPTVVVYTGRSLTSEEEQRLRQYSNSIIVKGARSPERLLDEVTLFLHQVESHLPLERQRMLKRVRHREAVFEDRRVLVVEDDVRNVFALTSALEPKGMKVTIARNGREALERLEAEPRIDLVLMDLMMPEMDGLEATRAIRKRPQWAKLPIIALTAKAMKDDQERCMQAGASDYIPKPLDVDMLLSLLRVWMPK
jgi:CheY-like chemotaxis protein